FAGADLQAKQLTQSLPTLGRRKQALRLLLLTLWQIAPPDPRPWPGRPSRPRPAHPRPWPGSGGWPPFVRWPWPGPQPHHVVAWLPYPPSLAGPSLTASSAADHLGPG